MLEPNEVLDYTMAHKQQEPETQELPQWLVAFFEDDDAYDIYSK